MAVDDEPWEGRCLRAAAEFATRCRELRDSNPRDAPVVRNVATDLLTELWDRGFSVSELRGGFEWALADLPRYAAGEDRRGDKGRS